MRNLKLLVTLLAVSIHFCTVQAQNMYTNVNMNITTPGTFEEIVLLPPTNGEKSGDRGFDLLDRNTYDPDPQLETGRDEVRWFRAKVDGAFKIGGLFPLRRSEEQPDPFMPGMIRSEAFRCTIDMLNADESLLPDIKLSYSITDVQVNNPVRAVIEAKNEDNENIVAVVGAGSSANSESAAKLLGSFGIPLVSYSSTSALLSDSQSYPTFARTVPSDENQIDAMIQLSLAFKWSLVTAFFTNDLYGTSSYAVWRKKLQNPLRNGRLLVHQCSTVLGMDQPALVESTLNCMAQYKVHVAILFVNDALAVMLANAIKSRSDLGFVQLVASDAWADISGQQLLTLSNSTQSFMFLEGAIGFVPKSGGLSAISNCLDNTRPNNHPFPQGIFSSFWEKRFICTLDNSTLIPQCPSDINQRNTTCRCTQGPEESILPDALVDTTMSYVYDATLAVANALNQIYYNCTSIPSMNGASSCPDEQGTVTAPLLSHAIKSLSFTGSQGTVSFQGNNIQNGAYSIVQLRMNGEWAKVGEYQVTSGSLRLSKSQFLFPNGLLPLSVQETDQVSSQTTPGAVINLVAGFGILVTLITMIFAVVCRETRPMQKSLPLFSYILLAGLFCMYWTCLTYASITTASCMTYHWMMFLGSGLTLGPLLAKVYRTWCIFHSDADLPPPKLNMNRIILLFTGVTVSINIILSLWWTFADGLPEPRLITTQTLQSSTYAYISCDSISVKSESRFMAWVLLMAVNAALMAGGSIAAFLTRKVDTAYSESRFVSWALYDMLVVCAIVVPLYSSAGEGPGSLTLRHIARASGILFCTTFTLGALFVPKLLAIIRTGGIKASTAAASTLHQENDIHSPSEAALLHVPADTAERAAMLPGMRPAHVIQAKRKI